MSKFTQRPAQSLVVAGAVIPALSQSDICKDITVPIERVSIPHSPQDITPLLAHTRLAIAPKFAYSSHPANRTLQAAYYDHGPTYFAIAMRVCPTGMPKV